MPTTARQPESKARRGCRAKVAVRPSPNDAKALIAVLVAGAKLPPPAPVQVLDFAEKVALRVHERRAAQLAAGQIDQTRHDQDVATAAELLRIAQDHFIADHATALN